MSTELAYVRVYNDDPTLVFMEDAGTDQQCEGQIQLVRDLMCSRFDWSPTDTQPIPPGIREEYVVSSFDLSFGLPFGMDAPPPRGSVCTEVKFIYDNQNFIESVYVPNSADEPETRIIDALHSMIHNTANLGQPGWLAPPTADDLGVLGYTVRDIFMKRDGPLEDGEGWEPHPWFNPAYLGVFLHFVPRLFFFLGQEAFPDPSAILDSPFANRHTDHIDILRGAPVVSPAEAEQLVEPWLLLQQEPSAEPYAASALARDDGTRQEIADYASEDEGFEFGSDEEYPMEAPLSEKDIRVRSQCSEMLQILEGVMEGGGQVNEGKYLEMCNILKELYKN